MTVGRYILALLALGLFVTVAAGLLRSGSNFSPYELGRIFGATIALPIFPLLVALPWRYFQRKRNAETSGPWIAGAVIFALLSAGILFNAQSESAQPVKAASRYTFSPAGCSHLVVFPNLPELKEDHVVGGGKLISAHLYQSTSFMRAECVPTMGRLPVTKEIAIQQLNGFSEKNGLQDVIINADVSPGLVRAKARGVKQTSGKWSTFEIHLLLDNASVLSLTVGGLSQGYPQEGLSNFLSSANKKSQ